VPDLEEAGRLLEHAVAAWPEGSTHRAVFASNLAVVLDARYDQSHQLSDLEKAIGILRRIIQEAPDSPHLPGMHQNLGNALRSRSTHVGSDADLLAARDAYRSACQRGLEVSPEAALHSARSWGAWAADRQAWEEAAEAYRYGLAATERMYSSQLLHRNRLSAQLASGGVHVHAAYALLKIGDARGAAVALETARARWLSLVQARERADLERVHQLEPALHARFLRATGRLRQLEAEDRADAVATLDPEPMTSLERVEAQIHEARQALDQAVEEIRRLPGYEQFLAAPAFEDIVAALEPGKPLVYLASAPWGGLALIVHLVDVGGRREASITHLPLDGLSEAQLRRLLMGELRRRRSRISWRRTGDTGSGREPKVGGYLGAYMEWLGAPKVRAALIAWFDTLDRTTGELWKLAMGPIIAELEAIGAEEAVLIPVGLLGLLPLHAAWTRVKRRRRYALDHVALSYSPSARALVTARRAAARRTGERLLAVAEPAPTTATPLLCSAAEVGAVCAHFRGGDALSGAEALSGSAATRTAVLEALRSPDIVHFSCHGAVDWEEPLHRGLLLANDEVLTVEDLFGLHLEGARMAVLSACETGVVGMDAPDEVVSLPAAFMRAGFAGVVASLWAVADLSTAMMMERFYHFWLSEGQSPARALRHAQQWLRDTTNQQMTEYLERDLLPRSSLRMPPLSAAQFLVEIEARDPRARSFEHPFWWAGFTLTGV
jgi:CHAT domain-containing protein/tetratricopeptide (TPR) repeat protein